MASPFYSSCIIRLNSSTEDQGIEVSVNYANFLSLDLERIWGDSANKFTLKLLDKTAYEVEGILLGGSRNIYMKYYINKGEGKKDTTYSREFSGNIWDYTIDFVNNMTILTITGTCGISVKDMYNVYNRLWNKVPTIKGENFLEVQLRQAGYYLFTRDPKDTQYYAPLSFREAISADGESSFQVSFMTDGSKEKKRLWYDCEMIYLPVRPSDIIKLMIHGGSLYTRFSPEKNTDIDYDSFADAGFNFGTSSSGATITYKMAQDYKKQVGYSTGGSGIPLIYRTEFSSIEESQSAGTGNLDMALLKAAVSCELIEEYLRCTTVDPNGWVEGEIETTEPICADLSQIKMSDTKYINSVLLNKSISSVKSAQVKANYYLSFDKDNKVSYKPASIEAKPKIKATFGQYLNPKASQKSTEGYGNDMILSFSYSSNIAAYIAGEGTSEFVGINYTTGEQLDLQGLSSDSQKKLGLKEGAYSPFTLGKLNVLTGESSSNIDVLLSKAQDDWVSVAQTSFKAEIQILGNVDLECGDYIEILNIPGGKMGKHHTSGIYLIMKIKESITKGTYLSTLTLVKNAASSGSGATTTYDTLDDSEKGVVVVGKANTATNTSPSQEGSSGGGHGGGGGRSFDVTEEATNGTKTNTTKKKETKTSTVVKDAGAVLKEAIKASATVTVAAVTPQAVVVKAVSDGVKSLVNSITKIFK